jgi:hypothetical protein
MIRRTTTLLAARSLDNQTEPTIVVQPRPSYEEKLRAPYRGELLTGAKAQPLYQRDTGDFPPFPREDRRRITGLRRSSGCPWLEVRASDMSAFVDAFGGKADIGSGTRNDAIDP